MMKGIIAKSLSEVQKLHIGSTLQVQSLHSARHEYRVPTHSHVFPPYVVIIVYYSEADKSISRAHPPGPFFSSGV
jgi:hypothetical protein